MAIATYENLSILLTCNLQNS